jgi:hypothetical protein
MVTIEHGKITSMQSLMSLPRERSMPAKTSAAADPNTVETRLWTREHQWLYSVFKSPSNVAPKFRFPDLISACVSIVFDAPHGSDELFAYMRSTLTLRDHHEGRRTEVMWRPQYQLLLDAQRSPANQYPNPNFQLDQLTTGCVALARARGEDGSEVLHRARLNLASRTTQARAAS